MCAASVFAVRSFGLVISNIKWFLEMINKVYIALISCDFMRFKIIYRSNLLAIKGMIKVIKKMDKVS